MFSMPTSFADFLEKWNRSGPYISAIVGAVFISVGLYIYLSQFRIEESSVPVSLEVLDMIENSDDTQGSFAPKFQIVEGTYKDKSYLGSVYISPPIHEVGDKVDGWYQEKSGLIRSEKMLAHLKSFGKSFVMFGLVLAFFGIGWAAIRRHKFLNSRLK